MLKDKVLFRLLLVKGNKAQINIRGKQGTTNAKDQKDLNGCWHLY